MSLTRSLLMPAPAYIQHPDFPTLTVFTCDSLRARLSPIACGRNYTAGRMLACSGCRTGHRHAAEAGLIAKNAPLRHAELEASKCARCRRGTTRVVHGRLCVSCFNREREFLKGRNAKGTRPMKTRLLVGEVLVADGSSPTAGGVEVVPGEPGAWLVALLVADEAELRRSMPAIAPAGELLELGLVPVRELRLQAQKVRRRGSVRFGQINRDYHR